jgi:four helix bundle protein
MEKNKKINMNDYKELVLWKKAHAVTLKVLEVAESFQKSSLGEVIARQMIRSSTSVPANIAEGFGGRKGKEFISYLYQARKSITETDYWLFLSLEKNLITQDKYSETNNDYQEILKLLNATLTKIRKNNNFPNP